MSIKVICADDHEIVRYGLCLLLQDQPDIEIIGQAANARETLDLLAQLSPQVVLLDLFMPGVTGTSLIEEVQRRYPEVRVVTMSGQADEATALRALRAGALAFVRKEDQAEALVAAVRAAAAGQRYLTAPLAQKALEAFVDGAADDQEARLERLTERELEIIRLAAEGMTNAAIGDQLFISRRTVETHRARAMHKLELHNEVELARFFLSREQ